MIKPVYVLWIPILSSAFVWIRIKLAASCSLRLLSQATSVPCPPSNIYRFTFITCLSALHGRSVHRDGKSMLESWSGLRLYGSCLEGIPDSVETFFSHTLDPACGSWSSGGPSAPTRDRPALLQVPVPVEPINLQL
ncbi:hypothetical protein ILYODFUR_023284 [Ilyodon furcidens]|uniref:Secreted protein n=1 Tax=Ilyodon furcidens TaxID=33524 RepID=A0ABV0TAT7_9TELE